jgi:hypothetical protein
MNQTACNNTIIQSIEAQKIFVAYFEKILVWLKKHPKSKYYEHETFSIHKEDLESFQVYCKENNLPFEETFK